MGGPSACEQCSKKLSVFSKRRKCVHCMAAVCKNCYAPHLVARHPTAAASTFSAFEPRSRKRPATISTLREVSDNTSDDDVHFLSPVNAGARRGFGGEDALLDGIDGVQVVSGGEDEDDEEDEDDDGDDDDDDVDDAEEEEDEEEDEEDEPRDAAYVRPARRMSMEEEHYQHKELVELQEAVATWARKEAAAEREQRIAKRASCYSMTPIPNVRSMREYQERELFVVSYAVVVTLLVWGVYGAAYLAYTRVRGEIVRLAV